jgi:antitoxin component YwqK of YwqJK toxin-antitoxin module
MKMNLLSFILLGLISYNCYSQEEKNRSGEFDGDIIADTITKYRADGSKEFEVLTRNGLRVGNGFFFDKSGNIIGFRHYENDTLNGFGLYLNEKTLKPKYLVEANKGKRDGVLIEFYDDGVIKSFRNADIYNDSQKIEFHENGTIKSVGKTKKGGQAQGTWRYFDENGDLEKTVEYENGNIKK